MKYKLAELIDVDKIQALFEKFSDATGTATAVLDLEGKVLVATGWQDICTKFHRIHPETSRRCTVSDTALAGQLNKGEKYNVYQCINGLVDVAVPIIIDGEHLGNFFTGQFFFKQPDAEFFRKQASECGFDENAYLEALGRVPVFSEKTIEKTMNFLVTLTVFIAETGLLGKQQLELDRINHEMELAKKIQTSLLPTSVSNIHPDFEIAAAMLTADQVGGDFYDISFDQKGNLWLAVGDVSGHGVTPGLIMMMAQTVHATITANIDCEACDVVVRINEILYKNVHERLHESHFMTFSALKYLGNGQFQHAGAHLSMIIYRQKTGECELIRTKGIYLNFKRDISKGTKNAEFFLDYGDILILYTDGLTEAQNRDGDILDIYGFVKIVEKHICQELELMKEMIMADVLEWSGNVRADDMSLVIVKRKKAL